MKMVKKILFGLVAVAAVLSLASCGVKDDTEGIIKGTAGNYSVNYTYDADTTTEYRAYKSTGAKHAGALVKVTFDKDYVSEEAAGNSKFGLIFGLTETKNGDQKIRDFYIVGLGANGDYYFSRYDDVVDIRANNFGATTTASEPNPRETEYKAITNGTLYTDADQNKYAYIWYQAYNDGRYEVKIGNIADDDVNAWKRLTDEQKRSSSNVPNFSAVMYERTLTSAFTECDAGKEPQLYTAVYARVQGSKTLNGTVKFKGDYLEAEDIEEID